MPKDASVAAVMEKHDRHVARTEAEESYHAAEAKAKAKKDEATLQWLRDNRHLWR